MENKLNLLNWFFALSTLSLLACGNNSNNAGPQAANVPMQAQVLINTCQRPAPMQDWWGPAGAQPYQNPNQTPVAGSPGFFPNGRICGCPANSMPTCTPQGLICLPMTNMNRDIAVWNWTYQGGAGAFRDGGYMNPYTTWFGGGGGPSGPIPPQAGGICPPGTVLDFDVCVPIQRHRFAPPPAGHRVRRPYYGPRGPRRPVNGYAYAYVYSYTRGGAQTNACSINAVAQICDVGPAPSGVSGMSCRPLAPNSPKGIWVKQ